MSANRDTILSVAASLTEAAYALDPDSDSPLIEKILSAAREIRGATLMGSLPDPSVMSGLHRLMTDLGLGYAVIGGLAVSVHGQERSTSDVDVLPNPIN